jgi:DNA (cytosine-5)-methyltransferase 3A
MNSNEREKCQTLPVGYTDCLSQNDAAHAIGDGWTVDVIAHIFKGLPKEEVR